MRGQKKIIKQSMQMKKIAYNDAIVIHAAEGGKKNEKSERKCIMVVPVCTSHILILG